MSKIILLIGASGSGKTTLGKKLEAHGIPQLVSFTTRPKRQGEVEGVDYYFTNIQEMRNFELAEESTYNGEVYGLFANEVDTKLKEHDVVYFICNSDGAKQIQKKYPEETHIFWLAIEIATMIERMRERGDSSEAILERVYHACATNELSPPELHCRVIPPNCSTEDAFNSIWNEVVNDGRS